MSKLKEIIFNPIWLVILAIVLFFGSCAWSVNNAPKLAFLASGLLFVFLGWATLGMGEDGRKMSWMLIPSGIVLVVFGIIVV
jgi:hypothetical protein